MTFDLEPFFDRQAGVVSAKQAESVGVTCRARRELVACGALRELRRGIFASGARWNAADVVGRHRIHTAGALLIRQWDANASVHRYVGGLRTAAFLLGLPVMPEPTLVAALHQEHDLRSLSPEARARVAELRQIRRGEGPSHVDLIDSHRKRRTYARDKGVLVRPATLPPGHVVLDGGVPITSLARTAVDLMREGSRSDALIVADAALHAGLGRAELEAVATFCAGWSNGLQALATVATADGRAESPGESLARFWCLESPEIDNPEIQVDLYDAFGWIARVDLLFRRFRVALEVDGLIKYLDPWCGDVREALRLQHEREQRIRRAGWIVIRTTWHELETDPAGFIRRLLAAFAQAA